MSFRTVVIKDRAKLDLNLNYLVCRSTDEKRVYIPEISVLILESTAISFTTALVSELVKNKVKIIFCDEKHNPESELSPYYGAYNSSGVLLRQINWSDINKQKIWTYIIKNKIAKQRDFLAKLGYKGESKMLDKYIGEIKLNDSTNREGHSAKVYFNAIWGLDFSRRKEGCINSALNYGYAVLLSCFNRAITSRGYLTQLGIWHRNEFNEFNLSCDFMEPFRVLIDKIVYFLDPKEKDYKRKVLEMFDLKLKIDGKEQFFENAISIYVQSVLDAIEMGDEKLIKMYE
jgi:CRISP-associated protein Cas1